MFEYCKNCKNHDDCFNNNWCVTMDRGRKIEGEYICDNFEPTLNSKIIFLRDIVKLQYYYIEIFEEEDSDFVNYKRVGALYRQVYKILNSITDVEQDKTKIYDIIGHGSWNSKDHSFKPICDDIRKLGYKVVERMKTRDGKEIEIYDVELNSTFEVEGNKIFVLYWNSNIGFGEMTFIKKDNEDGESVYEVETECMATNEHKEFIKLVLDKFIEKLNVIE